MLLKENKYEVIHFGKSGYPESPIHPSFRSNSHGIQQHHKGGSNCEQRKLCPSYKTTKLTRPAESVLDSQKFPVVKYTQHYQSLLFCPHNLEHCYWLCSPYKEQSISKLEALQMLITKDIDYITGLDCLGRKAETFFSATLSWALYHLHDVENIPSSLSKWC